MICDAPHYQMNIAQKSLNITLASNQACHCIEECFEAVKKIEEMARDHEKVAPQKWRVGEKRISLP